MRVFTIWITNRLQFVLVKRLCSGIGKARYSYVHQSKLKLSTSDFAYLFLWYWVVKSLMPHSYLLQSTSLLHSYLVQCQQQNSKRCKSLLKSSIAITAIMSSIQIPCIGIVWLLTASGTTGITTTALFSSYKRLQQNWSSVRLLHQSSVRNFTKATLKYSSYLVGWELLWYNANVTTEYTTLQHSVLVNVCKQERNGSKSISYPPSIQVLTESPKRLEISVTGDIRVGWYESLIWPCFTTESPNHN